MPTVTSDEDPFWANQLQTCHLVLSCNSASPMGQSVWFCMLERGAKIVFFEVCQNRSSVRLRCCTHGWTHGMNEQILQGPVPVLEMPDASFPPPKFREIQQCLNSLAWWRAPCPQWCIWTGAAESNISKFITEMLTSNERHSSRKLTQFQRCKSFQGWAHDECSCFILWSFLRAVHYGIPRASTDKPRRVLQFKAKTGCISLPRLAKPLNWDRSWQSVVIYSAYRWRIQHLNWDAAFK